MFNEGDAPQSSTDKPVALEFPIELEFRNVGFWGGRKTGEPREKPSEQGREPTTNSIHIWRQVRESNPGHIGDRRALSPLRHPYSPDWGLTVWLTHLLTDPLTDWLAHRLTDWLVTDSLTDSWLTNWPAGCLTYHRIHRFFCTSLSPMLWTFLPNTLRCPRTVDSSKTCRNTLPREKCILSLTRTNSCTQLVKLKPAAGRVEKELDGSEVAEGDWARGAWSQASGTVAPR